MVKQIRKWRQRRKIIDRIEWDLVYLEMSWVRRPADNEYLERVDTFGKRLARLSR